jgi:hypothetical protein
MICLFILGWLVATGCEEVTPPAPPATQQSAPATAPALGSADSSRDFSIVKSQKLIIVPGIISTPQDWVIAGVEGTSVVTLEGPGHDGPIIIQPSRAAPISKSNLTRMLADYERQAGQDQGLRVGTSVRGEITIVDIVEVLPPVTVEQSADGATTQQSISFYRWRQTFYVPGDGLDLNAYEFNVLDFDATRFEKNERLVREILASFQPEMPGT